MKITFKDLEDKNCESVTDYCRLLISENKEDYSNQTIEVYRGDMLCLTVTDIIAASKIMPQNCRWVRYSPRKRNKEW